MAKFPNADELKKIRKKIARVKGSAGLPPDASQLDCAKYKACEKILSYKIKKKVSNRQLAHILDCSEARVSEITNYHIEKYTLDRLISFAQIIDPNLTLEVA